jgi:hypothetical protein
MQCLILKCLSDNLKEIWEVLTMFFNLFVLFILGFGLYSCDITNNKKLSKVKSEETNIINSPSPINLDSREGWEQGSYSTVLRNLVPIDSLAFVGSKTIKLQKLDILNNLDNVSQETINNFIEKNESIENVKDFFDVYADIELVKIENSVANSLQSIRKQHPKAEGVFLLSGVGLNEDASESLIYVEKYTLEGKVTKKICFIQRDTINGVKVSWFDV